VITADANINTRALGGTTDQINPEWLITFAAILTRLIALRQRGFASASSHNQGRVLRDNVS